MRRYLPGRGETTEGKTRVQPNTGWTFRDEKNKSATQLTFHAGRGKEGWFELRFAPILRNSAIGELGEHITYTFAALEELIEIAEGAGSRKIMFIGRGKGGQQLVNWVTVAEVEHAIKSGKQAVRNWEAVYSHPRRNKR